MPTQLLTVRDVAALLKINAQVAQRRIKAGEIPAFRVGDSWRIHPEVFDRWLAQQAGLPTTPEQPRRGRKKTDYSTKLQRDYPDIFSDKTIQ